MSKHIIQVNLKMTEDFAYFIGAIKGDGHISKDKKYLHSNGKNWIKLYRISFSNQDFEFARNVYHIMKEIGLNPNVRYDGNNCIIVLCCSKILWEWFQNLTFEKLELLLKKNNKFLIAFIRGIFESEGCYYYETGIKYPFAVITNSNEELISFVHRLICELGFYAKLYKIKRGKTAFKEGYFFNICIRRKGEGEKFIKLIKPESKSYPRNAPVNYLLINPEKKIEPCQNLHVPVVEKINGKTLEKCLFVNVVILRFQNE